MYLGREETPRVFDSSNVIMAILLHIALFGTLWYIGTFRDEPDETVIPIECLVVVHENLDGAEDEPPPTAEPEPEPEPEPDPTPVVEPELEPPPPPPPDKVIEVPDEKKPEKKKIEPPKPSPEEIAKKKKEEREKKLAEMRKRLDKTKKPKPQTNGRTDKRPDNWKELLNKGYKPAAVNSGLDANESERCKGLIYQAFYDKWAPRPAWSPDLKLIALKVTFDMSGRVVGYTIVSSSGSQAADATVLSAAKRVGRVAGLTREYLENNRTVTLRFEVAPE